MLRWKLQLQAWWETESWKSGRRKITNGMPEVSQGNRTDHRRLVEKLKEGESIWER